MKWRITWRIHLKLGEGLGYSNTLLVLLKFWKHKWPETLAIHNIRQFENCCKTSIGCICWIRNLVNLEHVSKVDMLMRQPGQQAPATVDEQARMAAWERGHIDYQGQDSWANIQQHLQQNMWTTAPPPPTTVAFFVHQQHYRTKWWQFYFTYLIIYSFNSTIVIHVFRFNIQLMFLWRVFVLF